MTTAPRIDTAARRRRLGRRHHLTAPADSVETIAADLVGLHSSDPVTVYLSVQARLIDFTVGDLETVLYERRSLLRVLGMRRTMFVVPRDLAATIDAACARGLVPAERRRLVGYLENQGVAADGAAWLADVERRTLDALHEAGEATAVQLRETVPELKTQLRFGQGKTWGGTVGVSTRVLFLLAAQGMILRGRPLGSWLSSQYRWALVDDWIGGARLGVIDQAHAEVDLVRRWLGTYGPGTETDLAWWTGWGKRQTRRVLTEVGALPVELDEGTGYVLPADLVDDADDDAPWVALLPSLDPAVMGWKERNWFLGPHQAVLFDRNGNAGPTAWSDGRIVGGWAQRDDGTVAVELLEDVGREATTALHDAAHRLTEWLGDIRINPRFRSPLDRRLGR